MRKSRERGVTSSRGSRVRLGQTKRNTISTVSDNTNTNIITNKLTSTRKHKKEPRCLKVLYTQTARIITNTYKFWLTVA